MSTSPTLAVQQPVEAGAPTALVLTGLVAGYGRTLVLKGVDLVVPQGKVVALLGPNGAGKSTLFKTVSGLLPAASGAIQVADREVTRLAAARRTRLGVRHVPEERGVYRSLTAHH